jgi:PhzF family phenazine biosynthesis protein
MTQKIYQVDAFTNKVFGGNPAAICPLKTWLPDAVMQNIAMENNLAETAFYVQEKDTFHIRWFTPNIEVDLCGHATLAAAYVLAHHEGYTQPEISFHSHRSGELLVRKEGDLFTLNFPTDVYTSVPISDAFIKALHSKPIEAYKGKTDYMLIYETEEIIQNLQPNFEEINKLDCRGVIVTAPGTITDFVSRFFAPQCAVNEDPATGSAHTTLTPYWADKLNKKELTAIQLSARKGYLTCKYLQNRVEISGTVKLYLIGNINIA